jgi:hypothetical protein
VRFSAAFGIKRTKADDWLDPHLTVDTKLFVDPLLMLLGGKEWVSAHDELSTISCSAIASCPRLTRRHRYRAGQRGGC